MQIDPPSPDATLAAVLAGIAREPVPERLRNLALRLEAALRDRPAAAAPVQSDRLAG